MLLSWRRLLWWRCYVVGAQGDACAWPWPTWRLVLDGSGSAAPRAPTSCDTSRLWSKNTAAGPREPLALTFLCSYVAISTQSQLRRCTDVSPRRLSVWTRPIRNSARMVWLSRNTQHGRFGLRGNAVPLWTTSGTVRTHWEWKQFWTCPLRNRLGQTGFHPLVIHLTISLWFVTSALRRSSEKEVTNQHTGRDDAAKSQSGEWSPGWLHSTSRRADETPREWEEENEDRTPRNQSGKSVVVTGLKSDNLRRWSCRDARCNDIFYLPKV